MWARNLDEEGEQTAPCSIAGHCWLDSAGGWARGIVSRKEQLNEAGAVEWSQGLSSTSSRQQGWAKWRVLFSLGRVHWPVEESIPSKIPCSVEECHSWPSPAALSLEEYSCHSLRLWTLKTADLRGRVEFGKYFYILMLRFYIYIKIHTTSSLSIPLSMDT